MQLSRLVSPEHEEGYRKRRLTNLPSVVKLWHLPYNVGVSDCIVLEEGAVLIVEALEEKGENHLFEFTSGSHPQSC